MAIELLPADFDEQIANAVEQFWKGRTGTTSSTGQSGSRGKVISGKNMDGFVGLVGSVVRHCGLSDSAIRTSKREVVLPGYFRATKDWDALVISRGRLLGAFEFKSQVGSFGNNFNNRSEEVIGSAADLWMAHHHGAFSDKPASGPLPIAESQLSLLNPALQTDPRPPFIGWLMLLEDCAKSRTPVRCNERHFKVFSEFREASYARRYQILCERLVERRLYSAAALELTQPDSRMHEALSRATSIRTLFAEFAARLLAAQA